VTNAGAETTMSAILADVPQLGLWTDLVHEAEHGSAVRLDEDLESYLVFLLMAHTRDVQLDRNAVALEFLRAREWSGARLKQELREVGDRCLLLAGLYPEQAERRMVSVRYFLEVGSRAYDELASTVTAGLAELYDRLAQAFARVVRVLMELRRRMRSIEPLVLHELAVARGADVDPQFPGAVLLSGTLLQH
jgi:hypothetical protein